MPALPHSHLPPPTNHRDLQQLETLLETAASKHHDDMAQGFCPKTLRLSRSFPSTGHLRHPSSGTLSVTQWKDQCLALATSSHEDDLLPTRNNNVASLTFKPSSSSLHRLRTRSLDRKSNSILNLPPANLAPHKKSSYIRRKASSSNNSLSDPSSLPANDSCAQRHSVGFHSHIPIERTVLSVLPSSRRPSVDWSTPAAPEMNAASFESSPSATSSGSPKSTLATSVDSSGASPRPRYQPRPLLLSAFGANNKNRTSIDPSKYPHHQTTRNIAATREQQELAKTRRMAEVQREKVQQVRQERLHAREAKKLRKRAREAELEALSSSVMMMSGEGRGSPFAAVPEADEDNWSWLSCSDAASDEEENELLSADDQDAEEIAVVWRASLDVGRRVAKGRKALGRGHGIPLPPTKPSTTTTIPQRALPVSSSLSPLSLFHMLFVSQKRPPIVPPKLLGPVLFSSGMLSGLACSLLLFSSSLKLDALLSRRHLLPLSSSGIVFFFNLVFPSPLSSLGSIATSVGLSVHW